MRGQRLAARLRRRAAAARRADEEHLRRGDASIRQDKDLQAGDPGKIEALVEAKVLPHFDSKRATQIAMGANWRRATPEQQERLVREFRTLLVRTYSGALASYGGQTVAFRPLRAAAGDAEVTVRSQIKQPGAEPIAIEYDMAKTGSGWTCASTASAWSPPTAARSPRKYATTASTAS